MAVCCPGWIGIQLGQEHATEERPQLSLSAARSINNAAALRKFTRSLVTRVRKFIHAGGEHFEQLT